MIMSDPRKTLLNTDVYAPTRTRKIDDSTITYDKTKAGGAAAVGKAVKLSTDDTIALTTDGSMVLGKLESVEPDGFCTVRERGPVSLPGGSGASLTVGKKIVGAVDGSSNGGFIREVATATAAELGLARGYICNNDDTTAVVVDF
jgi:hypothetical protein